MHMVISCWLSSPTCSIWSLSSFIYSIHSCALYWWAVLTAKIGTDRSDRSRHCGLSGRDRPVWPVGSTGLTGPGRVRVQLGFFHRFRSINRISCGISPPHLINIKGHGRLGYPIDQIQKLLSFYFYFALAYFHLLSDVPPSSLRRLRVF